MKKMREENLRQRKIDMGRPTKVMIACLVVSSFFLGCSDANDKRGSKSDPFEDLEVYHPKNGDTLRIRWLPDDSLRGKIFIPNKSLDPKASAQ